MAKINRYLTYKCGYCKELIPVVPEKYADIIKKDNKYYHKECYLKYLNEKILNSRTEKQKNGWLIKMQDFDDDYFETQQMLADKFYKDKIYKFILANYSINVVPSSIFTRLDAIYSGTYKGLFGTQIKPSELLEMWNKMMRKLNQINADNITKGKILDPIPRIYYDLAILVSKYDSYCRWRDKQVLMAQNEKQRAVVDSQDTIDKFDKIISNNIMEGDGGVDIADAITDAFDDD